MPHSRDRRVGRCDHRRRSALPCIAGALRRSLLGGRLDRPTVRSGGSRVHFPPSSSRLAPAAGSLDRRATGTRPVHSPFFVMWPGVWAEAADGVKRPAAGPVRARRSGAPAVADSGDSADPFANAGRDERRSHARTARHASGGTCRRAPRPPHPGRRTDPPSEPTPRSASVARVSGEGLRIPRSADA